MLASSIVLCGNQRKVKFPQEFDALDLATDELREKLLPVSRKLKAIEKERGERRKVRKRTKQAVTTAAPTTSSSAAAATVDVEMADVAVATTDGAAVSSGEDTSKEVAPGSEFEDEVVVRKREAEELAQLIAADVKADIGSSATGLYDLVGACFSARFLLFLLSDELDPQPSSPIRAPPPMQAITWASSRRASSKPIRKKDPLSV